jgi:predicted transcriptional regulator
MSIAEIKQAKLGLIAWIEQLSDASMLSFLESLKDSKTETDWWDTLTPDQIRHINEGIADADNGRLISSEEMWKKLKDA